MLTKEEQSSHILFNRIRSNRQKKHPPGSRFRFRAIAASRWQAYVVVGGIIIGSAVVLGPWMIHEYREMLGLHYVPLDPSKMPALSCDWWESEWRKMNPYWRRGESHRGFHEGPFSFIEAQTGRDLHSAESFLASAPDSRSPSRKNREDTHAPAPRVLIPLCGDSPMLQLMAKAGYEVDGIDGSQTAVRAAVERTERGLSSELFSRVRLHWSDFFSPHLWNSTGPLADPPSSSSSSSSSRKKTSAVEPMGPTFDIIYERQGLTSIPHYQRKDYAHLLSRVLAVDGVLYVEGIYRTGRVKGNKQSGPPFGLSWKELRELFPAASEGSRKGFHVVCEEKSDAMASLSREDRVLRRVPKSLYVTPFHCVVFRQEAVNEERRAAGEAKYAAWRRAHPSTFLTGGR